MTFKHQLMVSCAFAAAFGLSTQALAQAPAAPAAADAGSVAEIVVTAQNRVQNVQDVPIKIDVINAEQLSQAGFKDAGDLYKVAPVAMVQRDQGNVQVTVRGVGNTAGGTTDNSVVTNIDGEYINTPAALGISMFDLERVEVLRGPQGTLYGRNATGGAVNFITRKPGHAFGANAEASYGNYNAVRLDGGVDVPLGENVAMRFAGFYDNHDGYVKHPGLAAGRYGGFVFPGYSAFRSDDNNSYGGRAALSVDNIGGLTVYAAAEASHRDYTPQIFDYADTHQPGYTPGPTCSNPGWQKTAPLIVGQTLCIPPNTNYLSTVNRAEFAAPANGKGHLWQDTYAFRGRVDYEFSPAATLSYIGGYRHFEVDPKSKGSLPVVYANTTQYNKTDTQSHELRLAGNFSGITYQVGGFYFKEVIHNLGGFYIGDITPNTTNFGLYVNYNRRDSSNDSKSAFGQIEVPLMMDKLTAVGGLRYTDNSNRGFWQDKAGNFIGPAPRHIGVDPFTPERKLASDQSKTTWLVGLNYKPDPETLFYAKVSTGFKGGSFDAVGTFGPETNTAYEAGMKKNWGRNLLNLTGFYYDYTGLQVNVLLSSAEGGRTFNAGKATIWGLEAETQWNLTSNDHLTGSINYLNAELKELFALYNVYCVPIAEGGPGNCKTPTGDDLTSVGDLDPNTPGVQSPNFAGHKPGYSPKWIITFGYDHVFDLGGGGTITARANTTFKSRYFTNFLNYNDAAQDSFTSTDASIDYNKGGLTITAFVRNIENKRPLVQAYFLAAATDDIWNWQFGTPRTYGVKVGYKF